MSLNNIKLTPSLAAALYQSALVDGPANESIATPVKVHATVLATTEAASTPTWKSLGDNKKNILIAVNYSDATYLPDEELGFLTSILSACKLGLADVAIVNTHNNILHTYKDYSNQYNSKTVLLFGIDPESFGLPLSFPHFQVQLFAGTSFLYSPALGECHNDPLLKSKLWVCLRRIFGV